MRISLDSDDEEELVKHDNNRQSPIDLDDENLIDDDDSEDIVPIQA